MDGLLLKLLDWAVQNGLVIPLALIIAWDKWRDREEKKDLAEKKKNGEYVSWESMDARIKGVEGKISGANEKLLAFEKDWHSHMMVENLEEGRFTKLEAEIPHLKENISDVKGVLQEVKENQRDIFSMIAEIKNMMIQQRGH